MILRAIVRIDHDMRPEEVAEAFVEAIKAMGLCVETEDVGEPAIQYSISIHSEEKK